MICPNCRYGNPKGAKFCNQCGTKLLEKLKCPNPECGCDDMPEDSYFCPNCGTPLKEVSVEVKVTSMESAPKQEETIVEVDPPKPFDGKVNVNDVVFKMIKVEGGTFDMKETVSSGFLGLSSKEIVQRTTLNDYWIGETQVTQALWKAVMGNNPSCFKGDNLPVETISWDDCQTFISKLNSLTGKRFRLPTEAEWEFAARGGNNSNHTQYSGSDDIDAVAWYDGNSGDKTHRVATKQANELGIYDMSGNVLEWCQDWYGNYSNDSQTNPTGPTSGSFRVLRGGSWYNFEECCRLLTRSDRIPYYRGSCIGLRLVLS